MSNLGKSGDVKICFYLYYEGLYLSMSPTSILTRLLATTQLEYKDIAQYNNLSSLACHPPDAASQHQYEHNVRPLNVQKARGLGTATEHPPE